MHPRLSKKRPKGASLPHLVTPYQAISDKKRPNLGHHFSATAVNTTISMYLGKNFVPKMLPNTLGPISLDKVLKEEFVWALINEKHLKQSSNTQCLNLAQKLN